MKVLLVSHAFPPEHAAGTEAYTAQLGIELARLGHDVHVFTTEKDISRPHLSSRVREHAGLQVHEVFNNLYYDDFRQTWDYPALERVFEELLDQLRPDVVHFQHLLYLSVGCVEAAARRSIPVLFTLHDYWLQCARFGQRIHADGKLCHTIDFERCGTCLVGFKYAQSPLERRLGRAIAQLRKVTGYDAGAFARDTASRWKTRSAPPAPKPDAAEDDARVFAMAEQARLRAVGLRERLLPHVQLFLSPSEFLRRQFVEWGFPAERVRHVPTGVDTQAFHHVRRVPRGERLRVAFVGTLAPAKGPHLLLDAWGLLGPELRARGTLRLHGPDRHQPEYQGLLAQKAALVGAELGGPLSRAGVIALLCETDLLVVPSVWYENAPLVILEAIACRTPLLVADLGGMAELVEEGVTGFHFETGSAGDLAAKLARFLEHPLRLDGLRSGLDRLRTSAELAADVERLYREALDARRARS